MILLELQGKCAIEDRTLLKIYATDVLELKKLVKQSHNLQKIEHSLCQIVGNDQCEDRASTEYSKK